MKHINFYTITSKICNKDSDVILFTDNLFSFVCDPKVAFYVIIIKYKLKKKEKDTQVIL